MKKKRKVSSVEEEVDQVQGSMGVEEGTAVKDVYKSEMEEDFVVLCCEHTEEFGGRAKSRENQSTAAEKNNSGAAASAETQDYVSRQQTLEEIDRKEMEELSFVPSAVREPR